MNASSTGTDNYSPNWQIHFIANCVVVVFIILLVCWLYCACKNESRDKRLYLSEKETEPELTYTLWKERRRRAASEKRMEKIFGFRPANQTGNGISITSYIFSRMPWRTAPKPEDKEKLASEELGEDKDVTKLTPPPMRTPTCVSDAPPAYELTTMETPVCWWDALVLRIT